VPRAYALRKRGSYAEDHLDGWCRQIVESHYDFLRSMTCDTCLIADHEFVTRDRAGRIIGKSSTLYGQALPEPDVSWTWSIVPPGEGSQYFSKELNVGAWYALQSGERT
jgi:hypothetical protein